MTAVVLNRPPGPAFRPVKHGNAFEQTVERLMQAIKLGMVSQGDRPPPERELADALNVMQEHVAGTAALLRGFLNVVNVRSSAHA